MNMAIRTHNGEAPGEHSAFHDKVEGFSETLIFKYRVLWLLAIALASLFFGYHAQQIRPEAGFQKMIPQDHAFIQNYNQHKDYLPSPNVVRIVVESNNKGIFDRQYLDLLQEISEEVFYLPGVDRSGFKSLWTKNVTWRAVTEEGFAGGVIIGDGYDGSDSAIVQVRQNILRSGEVGNLVANDFNSSIISVPLLDINPKTNKPLDYADFSERLEQLRSKYSSTGDVTLRIVGFAKIVGNMIDAIGVVGIFFAIAVVLTLVLLYLYTRCIRATLPPLFCSLLAIVWQLGALKLLGFGLDPFSILVPFLIFAIGVSHAVQNVNYMAIAAGKGANKFEAAKESFRAVFAPGLTALISDGFGFFSIYMIPVQVIQELAIAAAVGITTLVFSKLILLPLIMSYTGITESGILHANRRQQNHGVFSDFFTKFTRPSWARAMVIFSVVLMALALLGRMDLKVGDLDKGTPEFHPDSVYNQDVAYVVENYSSGSDVMVVMVETEAEQCTSYRVVESIDRFQNAMSAVPGVQSVNSLANASKRMAALLNEGNIKWSTLYRNQAALDATIRSVPEGVFFNNDDCHLDFIYIALDDHKAETLTRVTGAAKQYIEQFEVDGTKYLLAAGNAGIEAATNEVIEGAQLMMLVLVYGVVTLMVFLTFRNFQSVVCIMVPLTITSMLCEAVMAQMGIGIKVSTLPVIALGVGIGVDYGIYIYSRMEHYLKLGLPLKQAYHNTMLSAGKAVLFTGFTLSVGVATWLFSPLKFQADMGLLLIFMFLWNMVGAKTLLPAIAYFMFKQQPEPVDREQPELVGREQPEPVGRKESHEGSSTSRLAVSGIGRVELGA